MTIVIEREKLKELLDKGVKTYYIEKKQYGQSNLSDVIMKEIETFLAFENESGFIGSEVKKGEA